MTFQNAVCYAILISCSNCIPIDVHTPAALVADAPVVISAVATGDEFDSHPKYEFSYGVNVRQTVKSSLTKN